MSTATRRRTQPQHSVPTMATAITNASKLTEAEVRSLTVPNHQAVESFRQGRGVYPQWLILCRALHLGRAIESGGVVTGLQELFVRANTVLQAMADRMEDPVTKAWRPGALHAHELQTLRDLVHDHAFQLRQISYGEYTAAYRLATARVLSEGGEVVGLGGAA